MWRTGGSEKHVDSHCPARISWVGVYSVLLVKGDEVSHVYTGTGSLLPGLSSVFKSMRWQIQPRKHSGALAIKSSVVFLNIAWNLTWLPVEYHSLGKCHTPYLDMGLRLKTKACHFAEGSIELIFSIVFPFQCHSFSHFAHPPCDQACVSSYCVNKPRPWSSPVLYSVRSFHVKPMPRVAFSSAFLFAVETFGGFDTLSYKREKCVSLLPPYITTQGEWWTKTL